MTLFLTGYYRLFTQTLCAILFWLPFGLLWYIYRDLPTHKLNLTRCQTSSPAPFSSPRQSGEKVCLVVQHTTLNLRITRICVCLQWWANKQWYSLDKLFYNSFRLVQVNSGPAGGSGYWINSSYSKIKKNINKTTLCCHFDAVYTCYKSNKLKIKV